MLTGGAALLQNIQHDHEVAQTNRQQLATHRFEITHRLDQMEYGLRRAKTVGEAKAAMDNMFKSKYHAGAAESQPRLALSQHVPAAVRL